MTSQNASPHYSLEQLTDGVYAALARDGGAAVGNAGIVDLGDSTLVIDTFLTPTAAEDLRLDAQRLTGRAPDRVVNTHYHNDHIWGSQVFQPEADLISTVQTRELIRTAGQEEYDYYRSVADDRLKNLQAQQANAKTAAQRAELELMIGFFSGLKRDFPRLRVTLPNQVFENRMVLYGSRRRVELIAFAGAHTGSDAVVYLPDDGIVFMSDLLFAGYHAYLGDGDPERWLEVLGSISDGSAGIPSAVRFVPGHGPTGTLDDLHRLAEYIRSCQQIARTLAADGKDGQPDVNATPIPEAYNGWMLRRFFYANLSFLLEKYRNAANESEWLKSRPVSNSFRG